MPRIVVQVVCSVCGCRYEGKDAVKKARQCERLGRPAFKYEVESIVQNGHFEYEVIERKYRRRGSKHTKVYLLKVTVVKDTGGWLDGIGPVGDQHWEAEQYINP